MLFTISDVPPDDEERLIALFDRNEQYDEHAASVVAFVNKLNSLNEIEARRALRQLQREYAAIEITDFFRTSHNASGTSALVEAEKAFNNRFSPDEPAAVLASITRREPADFQGRTWATRSRLWVDRVCSAWLIRKFIDPKARFLWLKLTADCPPNAVGFDFDGAMFTHVGSFVTFEVLLRSFSLDADAALAKIGMLVHVLDVGGPSVAEAAGFEAILTGARERCSDDNGLLDDMSRVLDDLYQAFSQVGNAKTVARKI